MYSAFLRLAGPAPRWLDAHDGLGLSAFAQVRQAVLLPLARGPRDERPPEKSKVFGAVKAGCQVIITCKH